MRREGWFRQCLYRDDATSFPSPAHWERGGGEGLLVSKLCYNSLLERGGSHNSLTSSKFVLDNPLYTCYTALLRKTEAENPRTVETSM